MKRTFYLLALILFLFPMVVQAVDGQEGRVDTRGKITFYDETDESEEPETSGSSESEVSTPPTGEKTGTPGNSGGGSSKPSGRLPDTGELMAGISFAGLALALLSFLFFFIRRKTKEEEK